MIHPQVLASKLEGLDSRHFPDGVHAELIDTLRMSEPVYFEGEKRDRLARLLDDYYIARFGLGEPPSSLVALVENGTFVFVDRILSDPKLVAAWNQHAPPSHTEVRDQ